MKADLYNGNEILKKNAGLIYYAPGSIFGFDPGINSEFFRYFSSRTGPFIPGEYTTSESGYLELRLLNDFYAFLVTRYPELKSKKRGKKSSPFISINDFNSTLNSINPNRGQLSRLKTYSELYGTLSGENKLRLKLPFLFFADFTLEELKILRKKSGLTLTALFESLRNIRSNIFSGSKKSLNYEWKKTGETIRKIYREHRLNFLQETFRISEENHNFDLKTIRDMEQLEKNISGTTLQTGKKHLESIPFLKNSCGAKLLHEDQETYSRTKNRILTDFQNRLFPDVDQEKRAGLFSVTSRVFFQLEHLTLFSTNRGKNCPDRKQLYSIYTGGDSGLTRKEMQHVQSCSACSMILQYLSRCTLETEIRKRIPSPVKKILRRNYKENNRIRHFIHVAHDNNRLIWYMENITTENPEKHRIKKSGALKIPLPQEYSGEDLMIRFRNGQVHLQSGSGKNSRTLFDPLNDGPMLRTLSLKSGECRIFSRERQKGKSTIQLTVFYSTAYSDT